MISGLHIPTGGHIYFGSEDVTHVPPENRGIGLVFQNYALYPHFSVAQNISFPLDNVRLPGAYGKEKDAMKAADGQVKFCQNDIKKLTAKIAKISARIDAGKPKPNDERDRRRCSDVTRLLAAEDKCEYR